MTVYIGWSTLSVTVCVSGQGLEGGLIRSPTGAGEPNMITLVPNIYIRRYLEETGLLTEQQRRQTNHNLKSGETPGALRNEILSYVGIYCDSSMAYDS